MTHTSPRTPLAAAEIAVVVADVLLAVVLLGVAALLAGLGIEERLDPNSPHGGAFQALGALLLGGPGALFALAAVFVWRRWQGRWIVQALPVLAVLGAALWIVAV